MENVTESINWAKGILLAEGYIISDTNDSSKSIQTTPWSSITRFLTSSGYVYLKQMPPTLALEPIIMQILHDQLQVNVPVVIGINEELSCFLMKDSGKPLREFLKDNFQPDLLYRAVKKYSRIQLSTRGYVNTFLDLGVPDWRLEKLPNLYGQLIAKEDLLKADGMTTSELNLLHELYPRFLFMCELLSGYKIPATLDHCDFHDNNVLVGNNANDITIIDWGETVITHPFFSLITFLNTAARRYNLKETDKIYVKLQSVCFENWGDILPKNDLSEVILLAKKLWSIYSAFGFYRLMMGCGTEEFRSCIGRLTGYFREFIKI